MIRGLGFESFREATGRAPFNLSIEAWECGPYAYKGEWWEKLSRKESITTDLD